MRTVRMEAAGGTVERLAAGCGRGGAVRDAGTAGVKPGAAPAPNVIGNATRCECDIESWQRGTLL